MWTTIILLGMLTRRSVSFVQHTTTSRRISTILKPLCASSEVTEVTTSYENDKKSICVVGGGFGGLYTALKLGNMFTDKKDVEITLLDPKDKFVFLPLLYELAMGSASVIEVCPRYDALLKDSNVKFVRGYVKEIDIKNNEMKVSSTKSTTTDSSSSYTMKYDQLVMAVGAQPRLDLAPGMKEFALPFYRFEDAYELKLRLRALMDSKKPVVRVVVLGGGYSGVEVATSVAQYIGPDRAIVTIVDKNDRILQRAPANNRDAAQNVLSKLGPSFPTITLATQGTDHSSLAGSVS